MPVRFAAARTPARSPVARALSRRDRAQAANDGTEGEGALSPEIVAALRHFARDGLAAAATAENAAKAARGASDEAGYEHWLAVCTALDRRRGAALAGAE